MIVENGCHNLYLFSLSLVFFFVLVPQLLFVFFFRLHSQNIISPLWSRFLYAIWSISNYFDSLSVFCVRMALCAFWEASMKEWHEQKKGNTQSVIVKNECEWNIIDIVLNILKSHFICMFLFVRSLVAHAHTATIFGHIQNILLACLFVSLSLSLSLVMVFSSTIFSVSQKFFVILLILPLPFLIFRINIRQIIIHLSAFVNLVLFMRHQPASWCLSLCSFYGFYVLFLL